MKCFPPSYNGGEWSKKFWPSDRPFSCLFFGLRIKLPMKTHFSLLFSRSKMVIFVGCFIWISGLVVAGQRPYFYAAPTQHSSFQHVQEDVHGRQLYFLDQFNQVSIFKHNLTYIATSTDFANATDADRDSQLFLTDDTRNQTLVCSHGKCRVGVITSNGGSHWRVLDPQVR